MGFSGGFCGAVLLAVIGREEPEGGFAVDQSTDQRRPGAAGRGRLVPPGQEKKAASTASAGKAANFLIRGAIQSLAALPLTDY